jgi:hypothetical protein
MPAGATNRFFVTALETNTQKSAAQKREGPLRAYPNNPWRGLLRVGEGIAFAYPAKFFG